MSTVLSRPETVLPRPETDFLSSENSSLNSEKDFINLETDLLNLETDFLDPENEAYIAVESDSQIVMARHKGRLLSEKLGFSHCDSTLVATVISELARNIVHYAGIGEIILRKIKGADRVGIAITAKDHGPGIADLSLAQRDGFSTSGGLGLGLPGVKRIMDEFEINSQAGIGTIVNTIKWKS